MCSPCVDEQVFVVKHGSGEPDELGPDPPRFDVEDEHCVKRAAAALGRRARVEEPDAVVALGEREVGMAEDHRVAARKAPEEPPLAAGGRPRDVHQSDPRAAGLDDELRRQERLERGLVGVAANRVHGRPERAQIGEEGRRGEIAGVDDQVGGDKALDAGLGEPCALPEVDAYPRSPRPSSRLEKLAAGLLARLLR